VLLAIDTATDWAGIALYEERPAVVRYEATWWAQRRHTTSLMPRIDAAFRDQNLSPDALSGIAVAIGPGSYTGLRVGLSLAKGLAIAGDVPLVGIPTLDVVAYPFRGRHEAICAIIQAGRTRVCWALYLPERPDSPASGYHLDDLPSLVRALHETERPIYAVGEVTPTTVQALREGLATQVTIASPAVGLRRASYLAELGRAAFQRGHQDDPATLSPLYLRHPGSIGP